MAVDKEEPFIAPLHGADRIGRTVDANAAGGPNGEPQECAGSRRPA